MRILLLFTLIISIIFSCAPSRIVKPLQKKEKVISASLGGPLVGFAGTKIPIPFTTVSYAQGLNDKTTFFGSLHTTAALFGNFQTDIGFCQSIWQSDSLRMGFSLNPVLNFVFDKWEKQFRFWPQVDFNFYYELKPKKNFAYLGLSNWIELSTTRAHQQNQQNPWLPSLQLGYSHFLKKWSFTCELKWIAPGRENKPNIVDYVGLNGKGATGVFLNLSRRISK